MAEAAPKKSSLLKSAVEALSKGNHAEAVRFCKQVLKQDRSNYDAYVVLGKALFAGNQYDQAETSYRRATDISPSSLRAWQGLAELYETMQDFTKAGRACEAIIEITRKTDDKLHRVEYLRRLAISDTKTHNYEKACETWKALSDIPSISEAQRLEAFCGIADAQAIKMGIFEQEAGPSCSQQEQSTFLTVRTDTTLPMPPSVASEASVFSVKDVRVFDETCISLEALLQKIIHISPQAQRYGDLFLKLLLGHMLESCLSGGERYKKAQLQVLQHCVDMLSFYCSDTALEIAFTMCEEDNADQIFKALGMEKLADDRQGRLLWLGRPLAHKYPQHGGSLAIVAYDMHSKSSQHASLECRRSFCERALRMNECSVTGWQVLAEVRASEGSFTSSAECSRRGLRAVAHFRHAYGFTLKLAELRLQLILANALLSMKFYDESSDSFNKIAKVAEELTDVEAFRVKFGAIEGQIRVSLAREHFADARCRLEHLLTLDTNNHWALAELGWLVFQEGSVNSAIPLLVQAVKRQPDDATYHHRLGLLYWKASDHTESFREKAVEQFVLSAKLDPFNGDVYRFLGHYYSQVTGDMRRAVRCYQKSVSLNSEDSEAGEALCEILDAGGQETLEAAICREASQKSPRAFWAWRRMGYILVHQEKWADAVGSLQHAVRGYPTCADLWEALGLAYQRLGMLTAAIKAYGRAIALEDNSRVFASIERGNILLLLGSYKKAVDQFRIALGMAPQSPAAQYGLSSGLLGMSKECMALGAFGWAASLLKEASEIASTSSLLFGNIAAVWKLLGDIQVAYAQCLPWEAGGDAFRIDHETFRDSVCLWNQKRLSAVVSAKRAYQYALKLSPWHANLYKDISISIELIQCLNGSNLSEQTAWYLAEKMALGALILESDNADFWITLGSLAKRKAMQQHAFIRALQVDGSQALAWAQLGKLYLNEGQRELARQAFDRARSADPMLALSWAGMSVHDHLEGAKALLEAFASCLYAVQLMPVVEFQIGLGKLALSAGQLQLSQVFAAVQQAVQRAPQRPESHNLSGLVWESRGKFEHAIIAYKQARYALQLFDGSVQSPSYHDVSLNLARVLCQAGQAKDAVEECQGLAKTGMLDDGALQIYAVALWKLGKRDSSLSVAHEAVAVSNPSSRAATLGLAWKLVYCISGQGPAMAEILKTPMETLQDMRLSFIAFAIVILDRNDHLSSFLLDNSHLLFMHERAPVLHSLLAAGRQLSCYDNRYGLHTGASQLRKALHMYPQSSLIRNQLGFLLLSSGEEKSSHIAARCYSRDWAKSSGILGSTSAPAMLGATTIACSECGVPESRLGFSSCRNQGAVGIQVILQLQRWFHQEPWNYTARYLLVLNIFQKAREERYPHHLCQIIKRLVFSMLLHPSVMGGENICPYNELQLLLCGSEICLQSGDCFGSVKHATAASQLKLSDDALFFAHLQLARCYASREDLTSLHVEYLKCLQLRTNCEIAWITFNALEARFHLRGQKSSALVNYDLSLEERGNSQSMWMALLELVHGQSFLWDGDLRSAEKAFAQACSLWPDEGCLYFIHGAVCMELARQNPGSELLSTAVHSLVRAQSVSQLPIVSVLLAQAEASLGNGKAKWERNLRLEWSAWPADLRPAELYFQMHLLAKQSRVMFDADKISSKSLKSSRLWLLQAVHLNPSCLRYWEIVKQVLKPN